jgi:hypothetical protein
MTYNLFIDDIRWPSDVVACLGRDWIIVRDLDQLASCLNSRGKPDFISYDHDMTDAHYGMDYSDNATGATYARIITLAHGFIPYQVHSMNPEAKARIAAAIGEAASVDLGNIPKCVTTRLECDQCGVVPVREVLDGDALCQACCDAWVRAEGAYQDDMYDPTRG